MDDKTDKLIKLKKMLDEKLITKEEFEKMKNELLEVPKKIYDNSSNASKKEHWIKSTKLGIFCNKNEFRRKITALIIVLICLAFLISCLSSFGGITSNTNIYQVTQSTQMLEKINNYKIQILVSVIGLIGTCYYGNKLLDKKDIDNKVNTNTSKRNNSKGLIYWNKGIAISIVIFILSVLLKIFTNSFLWDFATFTFFTSIILFVVSMISGWYVMHKGKQKWPIWYSIIISMIIVSLVFTMIYYFCDIWRKDKQKSSLVELLEIKEKEQKIMEDYIKEYGSDIDFDNPASISNGKTIFYKYASDLNCYIKNMNISYLGTDNCGRYAFKGNVAVAFSDNSPYSQSETWYVILIIKGNEIYSYEGSNSYETAKLASNWGKEKKIDPSTYTTTTKQEDEIKSTEEKYIMQIFAKDTNFLNREFYTFCSNYRRSNLFIYE